MSSRKEPRAAARPRPRGPMHQGLLEVLLPAERDGPPDAGEEHELRDPEQEPDALPQPYRMISKLVALVFERAWEAIEARAALRAAESSRVQPTRYEPLRESKLGRTPTCLAASRDYVFVGGAGGFSAYDLCSGSRALAWDKLKVAVTALCVLDLGPEILIAAVDETGVARLFYVLRDGLFPVKAVNEADDVSKQAACVKMAFSPGGDFAAFLLQGAGDTWLDVYKLPREAWLKEAEHTPLSAPDPKRDARQLPLSKMEPQTPDASDAEMDVSLRADSKLALPAHILRVRPPRPVTGTVFRSALEVFAKLEDGSGLGSGQNHFIKDSQWEQQASAFSAVHGKPLDGEWEEEPPSSATFHFLLPSSLMAVPAEARSPAGVACVLGVHWAGSHNFFLYPLNRTLKDKAEPEGVWPCAAPIAASQLSPSGAFLALACEDGVLTLWDLAAGFLLGVIALPEDCFCQSVHFLSYFLVHKGRNAYPGGPVGSRAKCLVLCTDASLHLVAAQGGQEPTVDQLVPRPETLHAEAICKSICEVAPVPALPGMALLFLRDGSLQLLDVAGPQVVCAFALPGPPPRAAPWRPLFVVSSHHPCFLLRGYHPEEIGPAKASSFQNSLFYFHFDAYPPLESAAHHRTLSQAETDAVCPPALSLEQRCESFLQKRLENLGANELKEQEQWARLRKFSFLLQREHVRK